MRKNSRRGLCVGFSNGEETALHMLSCIHEDFEQSGSQFGHIFDSEALFWKYLAWANPELIFMPKSDSFHASRPGTPIRLAFEELAQETGGHQDRIQELSGFGHLTGHNANTIKWGQKSILSGNSRHPKRALFFGYRPGFRSW